MSVPSRCARWQGRTDVNLGLQRGHRCRWRGGAARRDARAVATRASRRAANCACKHPTALQTRQHSLRPRHGSQGPGCLPAGALGGVACRRGDRPAAHHQGILVSAQQVRQRRCGACAQSAPSENWLPALRLARRSVPHLAAPAATTGWRAAAGRRSPPPPRCPAKLPRPPRRCSEAPQGGPNVVTLKSLKIKASSLQDRLSDMHSQFHETVVRWRAVRGRPACMRGGTRVAPAAVAAASLPQPLRAQCAHCALLAQTSEAHPAAQEWHREWEVQVGRASPSPAGGSRGGLAAAELARPGPARNRAP